MNQLPNRAKFYIGLISIIAVVLLSYLILEYDIASYREIMFWVMLASISESLAIALPNGVGVSVGFAINLAVLLTMGPLMASIVGACGILFRFVKHSSNKYTYLFNTPAYKTVFNISQSIIITGISGITYVFSGGKVSEGNFSFSMLPILLTLLVYVLLNTCIISQLFSLLTKQTFIKIWVSSIKGTITSTLAVGTLGVLIALAYISYGYGAVLLFFGPLLLARYSFKLYMDMRHVYMETIKALTNAMEAKDAYTNGHASRVGEYAIKLAQAMQLPDRKIENIKTAALLHDIGKIGIDDNILKKPGSLTELEYATIQRHPLIGAQILKDVDFLREVTEIIKHHHERFDGKGYPDGVKGGDIPLEAAILSVADVYDAMTSDRPYRRALTPAEALHEIEKNAGVQFEPKLAKTFVGIIEKEIKKEVLSDVS